MQKRTMKEVQKGLGQNRIRLARLQRSVRRTREQLIDLRASIELSSLALVASR